MTLQFSSPKLVKYWTGSAWAESQDFEGYIKMWNGSAWQYVDVRPYADVPDVPLITFSPPGGTAGSPTADFSSAFGAAAGYTITASSSVIWTWDNGAGGFNGYASIASGGSSTAIELVAAYTGYYNEQTFNVSASNGIETKYWIITLTSEGDGGGGGGGEIER